MSTSKQFIEYFLDRMTDIGDITLKSMMGEYLIRSEEHTSELQSP